MNVFDALSDWLDWFISVTGPTDLGSNLLFLVVMLGVVALFCSYDAIARRGRG